MSINTDSILIATATYNEANNIRVLITRIRTTLGKAGHILVVDDNSPDGTSEVVREIMLTDRNVHLITRRFKLGIGSAHKILKTYAMVHNYKFLVTMDADLSHQPEEIPALLDHAAENVFVIGSRYVPGGKSDYVGFRKVISRLGNHLSRIMLGIEINEFTTSFRVFDVKLLKKIPLHQIKSNGYSYFMEIVSVMDELGAKLVEVPIHFNDRIHDVSKIPKSQALTSLIHLCALALRRRLMPITLATPVESFERCRLCGENALLPLWQEGREARSETLLSRDVTCSSIQFESRLPPLTECLGCGLVQVAPSNTGASIDELYSEAVDKTYLANFNIKLMTFRNTYRKISAYLPDSTLNILDIGSYYGAFLEVIKTAGHNGFGIEPSKQAALYSRETLGHNVVNGFFSGNTYFTGVEFDVVTAWDVIEHLEEPDRFIADSKNMLKNDGLFVCSTILFDSCIARILKKRWHWLLPMHLTYFKKHEFIDMLARHGFKVIAESNHTHYASLAYAITGATKNKGAFIYRIGRLFAKILPGWIVLPIALGDVRMFICKKSIKELPDASGINR